MSTAQEVFVRHFPGLSPDEVDAELSRTPAAGATPISAAALRFLAEHGGVEARAAVEQYAEGEVQRERAVSAAQSLKELVGSSWVLEVAASRLGVSRSRVSHRISAQTLYVFTLQGRRYVPQWQFVTTSAGASNGHGDVEPIPGLGRIVPLIPHHLHPLAVKAFMESPSDQLDGKSPVTFLVTHGPVEAVEELFIALGRW